MTMIERIARRFAIAAGMDPDEIVTHKQPHWMTFADLTALGNNTEAAEYYALPKNSLDEKPDWIWGIKRWRWWIPNARDVLSEAREPTEAMEKAGEVAIDSGDETGYGSFWKQTAAWQAMIDAALKEGE